ncbi:MAG TPA: hypothetical protein VK164_04530 [Flavobacterium sp.]|uniref:hypothetical protein n=1 Tax=Flavobacterium sp. TaxID=239 RepID=UPI002B4B1924|nr:hypothetical protein [Flavobacterium sp.]HLO73181.1 hypothetical protein [Flavobacterium sp.]
MREIIEKKVREGYNLDLGSLIDESFATFKKTFLIAGLGMLIISIVMIIIYMGIFGVIYGFANISETMTSIEMKATEPAFIIGNAIVTMFFSALFAPITAGFIHLNHLANTNQEIQIGTIFDFYKAPFFKQIFMSYLIIGFTTAVVTSLLTFMEFELLNMLFQIVIALFSTFTIPLIIYGEQNYIEAITKSIQLFIKQPFIIIIALIIAGIGMLIGIFALCIGLIFTISYLYSMYYAIYAQAIGFDDKSAIDEIGLE